MTRKRSWPRRAVAVLGIAATMAAGAAGAVAALAAYRTDHDLTAATVRIWTEPGREGALDLYVPLVDWGVRFPVVDLPARLRVDVRAVRRDEVAQLAAGRQPVERLRSEATDALETYIRKSVVIAALAALLAGALVAAAVRGGARRHGDAAGPGPRLRWSLAAAVVTAGACGAAVALFLPPRGSLGRPEYYANGPEIPKALAALDTATRAAGTLEDELDQQLLGLTRLVAAPAARDGARGTRRITVASDLHNNLLALPALERASEGSPLFFAGDLTDRGSDLESRLVARIVHAGSRFVFVSGNHDSDSLERSLARRGAVVLTERGRLRADGSYGPVVARVAGIRVAGYRDPHVRRRGERFRDRYEPLTEEQREAFARWLRPLVGRVDVVMVHTPDLAAAALTELRESPTSGAPVFILGHTHSPGVDTTSGVITLNGGTAGAGGTGNLDEGQNVGLARLAYTSAPFVPRSADLIEIDPASGSATARHDPF